MCVLNFFLIWVFFDKHSRITGLQGKGEDISLTYHYHFHTLQRHFDDEILIIVEKSVEQVESGNQSFCWKMVMITMTVVE